MRLLDLQLLRFGHFTDRVLDFESGNAGLQVIFGSNEAGKSTTLRAVAGLLFGISETTPDDHLHPKPDLRIGARLQNRKGERIQVIRRKGRKNTLLDPDRNPLDDGVLNPFLGGVGRELFETMFGLSHEVLIRGGNELLQGRGELGESLFGAGAGVRSLHAVRTCLREEADRLFAPRAQNPPLNRALKEFQEARSKSVQLSLRPRQWQELREALRETEVQLKELEHQHGHILAELNRLQRLQRVLPLIHRREELLRHKAEPGEVALLAETCAQERSQAQQTLISTQRRERQLLEEKQRCEQDRAALSIPEPLLALEDAIEGLRDPLGAYKKALHDLPGLQAKVDAAHQDACALLRKLGREPSLAEAERLRIASTVQNRIHQLSQEGTRLATGVEKARQDLSDIDNKLWELQRDYDRLPPPREGTALNRLVTEVRRRGDLEDQARRLEIEVAGLKEKADQQLASLLLWQGPLEQVPALPLPPVETVERYQQEFEALNHDRRWVDQQRENIRSRLDEAIARIVELEGHGTVPTEEELTRVRRERDEYWHRLRTAWLGSVQVETRSVRSLTDYEHQVRLADELADRLWHEADRAARYSTFCAERNRLEAELGLLDDQQADLTRRQTALAADWHALWHLAGINPLPPAEMKSWLGRHQRLMDATGQWRGREHELDALRCRIGEYRDCCVQELAALGESPAAENRSLAALLTQAEEIIEVIDRAGQTRSQLRRDIDQAEGERWRLQQTLSRNEAALAVWRGQWGEAIRPLDLAADASVGEVEMILGDLAQLFGKLEEARSYQVRLDQIGEDARQFAQQVAGLVRDGAPDLQDSAAEQAAAGLISRLQKARDDLKERTNVDKRLKQIHRDLDDLKSDREAAQHILSRLMIDAGVTTLEALEEAEDRSRTQREINTKLQDLEEQLLAEGLPLEALVAQARGQDPDRLPARILDFQEQAQDLGKRRDELRERVWTLQSQLNAMDGSNQAAQAAAEAQEALARIKTQVESYARLKLSALLLNGEIERYREQNQGPIVSRAGELFRHMTLDTFAGVSTDFAGGDHMILLCVRDNGQRVPVEGLSEGTRDQLYLALRLAGLERHLEHNEPLPLVIDDILINFDDHRARATLSLLGELSEKTQVLFFTHHSRMVELARETVSARLLKTHDLDRGVEQHD